MASYEFTSNRCSNVLTQLPFEMHFSIPEPDRGGRGYSGTALTYSKVRGELHIRGSIMLESNFVTPLSACFQIQLATTNISQPLNARVSYFPRLFQRFHPIIAYLSGYITSKMQCSRSRGSVSTIVTARWSVPFVSTQ